MLQVVRPRSRAPVVQNSLRWVVCYGSRPRLRSDTVQLCGAAPAVAGADSHATPSVAVAADMIGLLAHMQMRHAKVVLILAFR
jgi:hypothetical protein